MPWFRFLFFRKKRNSLKLRPLIRLLVDVGDAMARAETSRIRRVDVAGLVCQQVGTYIKKSDLPLSEKENMVNVCKSTLERAAAVDQKS